MHDKWCLGKTLPGFLLLLSEAFASGVGEAWPRGELLKMFLKPWCSGVWGAWWAHSGCKTPPAPAQISATQSVCRFQ